MELTRRNSRLDDDASDALLSAGFVKEHVLELIPLTAVKVLSHYTNHLLNTPLDRDFASQEWARSIPRP
jgi:hypothetical protein